MGMGKEQDNNHEKVKLNIMENLFFTAMQVI